jgi:hypothetical protein
MGGLKAGKRAKRRISRREWQKMLAIIAWESWLKDS